jgi:hypothetical protein
MPGGDPATGAPLALNKRIVVPTADGGSRRTTVLQAIVDHVEQTGVRPTLAAHAGNMTREQVARWLTAAARYAERAERGHHLTHNEQTILRFAHQCAAAKERWIASRLETHRQIAAGGLTLAEVVETVDPTQRDENGQPLVLHRRVRTSRTLPDPRAIEWELTRLGKEEGFAERTEVTGAEGGPIEVESREDREARIERELLAYQQGLIDADAPQPSVNGQ